MPFVVATLYHFFDFSHYAGMRAPLKEKLDALGVKGTLLLAPEGINGTVAGTREAIDRLLAYLKAEVIGAAFEHKESSCDSVPFARTKVKLKKETISLGEPNDPRSAGTYVSPQDWNALISDPETLVLDTRNGYEVELGTFDRACNPQIRHFKQFPEYIRMALAEQKHRKIATFCTGGIRCEKVTAWMKEQGFEHVYHLKGGILKYLEEIPQEESKWQGECFVFDERVAVGHGLKPSEATKKGAT
jgi:UPF0176 protein